MALFVIIFGVATILIFISNIKKSGGGKSKGHVRDVNDPSSALWIAGVANDSGLNVGDQDTSHGHHHDSGGHHGGFDSGGGGDCGGCGGHH